jgi:hypothetical protein
MSQELAEEQLIRSYFLGDLPESEQERIQERVVTDQDFFEISLIIESELVDDYAFGRISDREREKLESGFLRSPHEYRKVRLVESLDRYISNYKTTSESGAMLPSVLTSDISRVDYDEITDVEERKDLCERLLGEAQTNRNLILALMDDNWLGLELLLHLKAVPQVTQTNLASLTERDDSEFAAALSRLIDSGLVDETQGKYSCSPIGSEILEKLNKISERK